MADGLHADLSTGSFHFKSTAGIFSSVSVVFHLRLLKENISLSYIFSPRKHPLGTEFPIDSSEDAYGCYSEFINCNIAI